MRRHCHPGVKQYYRTNIASDYAKRECYQIHPDKSKLIVFGITNPAKPVLNGKEIPPSDALTHLGIDRHGHQSPMI